MAKFVLAYTGGSTPESPEAQQQVMEAWMGWFGALGDAVVDMGNPFGGACSIGSDGAVSDGGRAGLTGYSIIEATDLADAANKAKDCPVLGNGGGIDVYEAAPVM
ncbi:MAG TPA: hypothetical protein VMU09_08720 [Acidimicrobiales bacterium]|nr:hypothetical protein [Acidimicrobiales bacterium]